MAEKPSGLLVTDDSGNYYYLRPEILAQAKMPEEDVKKLKSGIASATGKDRELSLDELQSAAGGMVSTASIGSMPRIQSVGALRVGGVGGGAFDPSAAVKSTIMCPW
jgi:hypothetical protein